MHGTIIYALSLTLGVQLRGQLDLLVPSEAIKIVEEIPPIQEAQVTLGCMARMQATSNPERPGAINVEARAGCGTSEGSLIGRYVVNRRTGTVTTWGDNPITFRDTRSQALATRLVMAAQYRVLSFDEARCVAKYAAVGLTPNREKDSIDVEQLVGTKRSEGLYQVRVTSADTKGEIKAVFAVDTRTGHVQNISSGMEVTSAILGDLLRKIILLKFPTALDDRDGLAIALKIPGVSRAVNGKNCFLIGSSAYTPGEEHLALSCDGHYVAGPRIIVNLLTGLVVDEEDSKPINTSESKQLASDLISEVQKMRARTQEEIATACETAREH